MKRGGFRAGGLCVDDPEPAGFNLAALQALAEICGKPLFEKRG